MIIALSGLPWLPLEEASFYFDLWANSAAYMRSYFEPRELSYNSSSQYTRHSAACNCMKESMLPQTVETAPEVQLCNDQVHVHNTDIAMERKNPT